MDDLDGSMTWRTWSHLYLEIVNAMSIAMVASRRIETYVKMYNYRRSPRKSFILKLPWRNCFRLGFFT
jgi:hypothetical protein